ncbi:AP-3 complex subunit delta [Ascosphaera acerosa]|nr:AP-3 complex subunit delta [Ascosphaera acerosa]
MFVRLPSRPGVMPCTFEKSLYDLIRGLRNHRGREAEYIHDSIKECRAEIRSQDMDKKATALLKLVYLEMYGHDMSWASFHVLEVMSSQKYPQKRVGYLAAAQALRSDTDVLMLATNLLKKDLASPMVPVLSLPLLALPHVIGGGVAAAGQLEGGSEAASESEGQPIAKGLLSDAREPSVSGPLPR